MLFYVNIYRSNKLSKVRFWLTLYTNPEAKARPSGSELEMGRVRASENFSRRE